MSFYRDVKSNLQDKSPLAEMIDVCLVLTNTCSKAKKDNELRECLNDLKIYCSKLTNETEKTVDEKDWNFLIQHFSACPEYEKYSIYWFNRIMKEKQVAMPTFYTLSLILKPFSNLGDEEACGEIVRTLEEQGKASGYSYMYFVNACIKNGNLEKACNVVVDMKKKGIEPFASTYITLLKEATRIKNLTVGMKILNLIKSNKIVNIQLSMSVISFSLKMAKPEIAITECEKLRNEGTMDIVSWNCLIQAYIQMNQINKAIKIIDEMSKSNITPSSTTFTILITACANSNLYEEGKLLHQIASKTVKEFSVELHTSIINFYSKCGHPTIAIEECENLRRRGLMNIVSWNCLIQAYIQMNQINKAIKIIDEMNKSNITPSSTTFTILITACANSNLYEEGKLLHQIASKTVKEFPKELHTSIINFYSKCGHPTIAIEECENLRRRGLMNIVSWTCLIQAYIQMNQINKAIKIIDEMKKSNITPNSTTFNILITACANSNLYEEGKLLHQIASKTVKEFSVELHTSIINFYSKCGHPTIAIEECENLRRRGLMNIVSWTCLIQAYIQMNQINKAIKIIDEMNKSNITPSSTTFTILITACANSNLYEEGKLLHQIASKTVKEFSVELHTSIINFYSKCGHPTIAIEECENLRKKNLMDIVSWNCLIQAYVMTDLDQAIKAFNQMKIENVAPDKFTYVMLLSACGDKVATRMGEDIITEIKLNGMEKNEEVSSVMVYFYSRIGENNLAEELFDDLLKRKVQSNTKLSIITYNNMLSCYAQHGKGFEAKKLFEEMVEANIELNEQTFTIILSAFSHSGMIEEAITLFGQMKSIYRQEPSIITLSVMVDVFARAGRFIEAEKLIDGSMDFVLWNTLMGACRKFNNIELGEKVFQKLIGIDKNQAAPYILMSNIYTYHQMTEKADSIRDLMEKNEVKKIPGIVYHEENGKLYQFVSGSTKYDRRKETELMREEIYRKIIKAGYVPDTKWVTNSKLMSEKEKVDSLCKHAEKVAIAHAFVLNPNRKRIVLTKNLRVCNDCHNATAYISKVLDVEIIVRDANRYHHFKDGKCSCDNYW